ncbi:MAG: aminoacyl-tRNA hydrolase [Aquificaceae bacterium]|nr:aminoacyl-tRNA hydrolase [Aquificaceae bacterium]MCX8060908.1 aminoacyl-tRNA hydrolase [Aquificaceae bacterium]MDW8097560.1 aminoacyl-tRNA hydrolase [Aquificaceae bacterium]
MIRLLVGLGNPGKKYEKTRHNVGFMVVDEVVRRLRLQKPSEECLSLLYKATVEGKELLLAKPQTYMNNSGLAVVNLLEEYDLEPQEMLVVYDDLDLPLGRLRLRQEGSSGGHHGMESIIRELKTDKLPRLKVGIGRPADKNKVVEYVLSPFSDQEVPLLGRVLRRAGDCLLRCVEFGLEESMNFCNAQV